MCSQLFHAFSERRHSIHFVCLVQYCRLVALNATEGGGGGGGGRGGKVPLAAYWKLQGIWAASQTVNSRFCSAVTSCVCTCRGVSLWKISNPPFFVKMFKSHVDAERAEKWSRLNVSGGSLSHQHCACVSQLNLAFMSFLWCLQKESWGNINTSPQLSLIMQRHPLWHTHTHTQTCAYRMYFKSLMCKQLLLFAQTTCSFWTQTKLWRTMGCVNSVGCVGDALHERSISTWCRLHQMVGPGRTAASSNRTHTDLQKNGASSVRNIPTRFCFFLRSATFLRRVGGQQGTLVAIYRLKTRGVISSSCSYSPAK